MMGAGASFTTPDNPLYSLDELAQTERAEQALDKLIDQRRASQDAANLEAALWRESERRYRDQQRERNRIAWVQHHEAIAASLREDAARHEAAAERYLLMAAEEAP